MEVRKQKRENGGGGEERGRAAERAEGAPQKIFHA